MQKPLKLKNSSEYAAYICSLYLICVATAYWIFEDSPTYSIPTILIVAARNFILYGTISLVIFILTFLFGFVKSTERFFKLFCLTVVSLSIMVISYSQPFYNSIKSFPSEVFVSRSMTEHIFFQSFRDTLFVHISPSLDEDKASIVCDCVTQQAKKKWATTSIKKFDFFTRDETISSIVDWIDECGGHKFIEDVEKEQVNQ